MRVLKLFFFFLLIIAGTTSYAIGRIDNVIPQKSEHSFSNPNEAFVTHLNWKAKIDLDNKRILATATWDITVVNPDVKEIVFDTRSLILFLDQIKVDGQLVHATLGESTKLDFMGQALHIPINAKSKEVEILYKTSDMSAALQWVTPSQTHDQKYPFLYTQSEAALARSWIPCQDAPGIRFTYEAHIDAPAGFLPLMSVGNNARAVNKNNHYDYSQVHPIPSYLLALAVGHLTYIPYDKKNNFGIYAEEGFAIEVFNEFDAMPKMVEAANKLYGHYAWGRYDVIVLPPSFPFGGMENPNLTFATPTVITGNKDLVNLVAHELAHSWSGNLVTNATWNDFWLNEGFTMYVEQRIMEELSGRDFAEMQAALDVVDLKQAIIDFGDKSPDTHLKLNLLDRDPDDGMTDIAYDKGYLFLRMLEEFYGRQKWDTFLKSYFAHFAFTSISTEDFLSYLKGNLITEDSDWYTLQVETWVYGPGLPSNAPIVIAKRFIAVDSMMEAFKTDKIKSLSEIPKSNWTTFEWLRFLQSIDVSTSPDELKKLDELFKLTGTDNAEIATAWYVLCLKTNYESAFSAMKLFLGKVGRRKFLLPLYSEMIKSEAGLEMAKEVYNNSKGVYHSVSRNTISEMLNTAY